MTRRFIQKEPIGNTIKLHWLKEKEKINVVGGFNCFSDGPPHQDCTNDNGILGSNRTKNIKLLPIP